MSEYRCTCPETTKPAKMMEYIEYLPLKGGSHTGCTPMLCGICGKLDFMPKENWNMFIQRGEPEVVKEWEDGFRKLVKSQGTMHITVKKTEGFFKAFFKTLFGGHF